MTTNNDTYISIVDSLYPLYFKDSQNAVVKKVINNLARLQIEVTAQSFTDELNRLCTTEEIVPYITSPVRKYHLYSDILKVQDRRANYVGRILDEKDFRRWRNLFSTITDKQCQSIVEKYYPGVYNTEDVVRFVLTTLYQDKQDLTIDIFITQMEFLQSCDLFRNMTLASIKEVHSTMTLNKLIYRIFEDATYKTVKVSEYKQYDDDVRKVFDTTIYPDLGNDRAKKWMRLFESRKSVKFPPFYVYNEPDGDVTFTRENRGIYDYTLPPAPSSLKRFIWSLRSKKH